MCCNLTVEFNQFGEKLLFLDRIWILCSTCDLFADGQSVDNCPTLELFDIERRVVLRILKSTAGYRLSFEDSRTDLDGMVSEVTILAPLDHDEFAVFAREFADFDRWW
ncbi:hypothetical protein OKW34_005262 [Paraburkholderia youngii]